MTEDGALAPSAITWHVVALSLVAVLALSAARRWRRQPGFVVVATALAVVTVGWDILLVGPSPAPVAEGAAAAALPVLLATYPDGRLVPRWVAAPVVVLAGCGVLAMVTAGAATSSPWWRVVNWGTLLLLAAQVHGYRRRATTRSGRACAGRSWRRCSR